MKMRSWSWLTSLGLNLALAAILVIAVIDLPLRRAEKLAIIDPALEVMAGTYIPGTLPAGVLLLEGFGSDQTALRAVASEFGRAGAAVFSFDFPGHGLSPGGLAYDNATTDRLARLTLSARAEFQRRSGLQNSQIILLGHSLGGRVALQAAALDPQGLAGVILIGPQVNLVTNAQAEFFTGASDADLTWVQALNAANPVVPVLILSGEWDDVITPQSANLLLEQLHRPGQGPSFERQWILLPRLLHNYEPISPRLLSAAAAWAGETWGYPEEFQGTAPLVSLRLAAWVIGLAGILFSLAGAAGWAAQRFPASSDLMLRIHIHQLNRFLWVKLALWLAALPFVALTFGLFFFLPFNLPAFNFIYVLFIGGYGLLTCLLYALGKMPGATGRLPFASASSSAPPRRSFWLAVGVSAVFFALTAAYARSGWFFVFPLNERFVWLVLFTPVTALGFWIGLHEAQMVAQAAPKRWRPVLAATLINLTPFILWTALLGSLGSLSGLFGNLHSLLILAVALGLGGLILRISRRAWLAALVQAVFIYWLILPQGALFLPF
jgi:pimeloyl-ACP methyl ester carboxylesterase